MAWRVPTGVSILIFLVAAIIGAVGTVATHRDPGFLLGLMIIVGSCVAALCIPRKSVYLLIPLPALTYLVLCSVTGYIHDRSLGTSTTALASDFTQWLAGGFAGICLATVLVLLIFGARLLLSRQLVSGQLPMSAQRSSNGRFPRAPMSPPSRPARAPRGDRAPWDDPDPWNDRGGRADAPKGDRAPRDSTPRDSTPRDSTSRDSTPRDSAPRRASAPRERGGERDAWYEQPRSGRRGKPADGDQQRTQALPPGRQQPPGRGPNRDIPPGRAPRRPNDDPWRG
ncbi:MAG TPA: DUF6542 domain-containing protein [Trebonia sp.]|nr:DUF6542 domain-containing protein [Trebonia sp.]